MNVLHLRCRSRQTRSAKLRCAHLLELTVADLDPSDELVATSVPNSRRKGSGVETFLHRQTVAGRANALAAPVAKRTPRGAAHR